MSVQKLFRPAHKSAGEPLWLFVHIPKTAGSSFRTALAQQLKPEHNININHLRAGRRRSAAFDQAIEDFLALDKHRHFVFASGHLKMAEALHIQERIGRPVKLLTMLREPVRRVISDYRYQRTPAHVKHEEFGAAFPTLESFVESRRSQNKMFRYLALPGEQLEAAIARLESDFCLIGVAEMYPLSVKLCSQLIGPRFPVTTILNITQDTLDNEVSINEQLVDRIRQVNAKDERLWGHFRARLQGHE